MVKTAKNVNSTSIIPFQNKNIYSERGIASFIVIEFLVNFCSILTYKNFTLPYKSKNIQTYLHDQNNLKKVK